MGGEAPAEDAGALTQALAANEIALEADTMAITGSVVRVYADATATGGNALRFYSAGSATAVFTGAVQRIAIQARAKLCDGAPIALVLVDGQQVLSAAVGNTSPYQSYAVNVALPAGAHQLVVRYANDIATATCDRDLIVDTLTVTTPAAAVNPFAGEKFFVDPASPARTTANAWAAQGRTADAAQLEKIARAPKPVRYFAEWTETGNSNGVQFQVNHYVATMKAAGALPVIGAYAILHRDCSSFSAGGFSTPEQYRAWIDGYAAGIGNDKAIVILEPDAIAGMDCLSAADQQIRLDLLRYAVRALKARPNAHVYLDAGHSTWRTAATIIDRLLRAGIADADGFYTNNANFNRTAGEIGFAQQVSAGVGGKHVVIDTSRNGLGPYTGGTHDGDCPPWANPPGRALGSLPTASTGNPIVDAFFWLKSPGASDADCGPFPAAGGWAPDYALGLAQRAAF